MNNTKLSMIIGCAIVLLSIWWMSKNEISPENANASCSNIALVPSLSMEDKRIEEWISEAVTIVQCKHSTNSNAIRCTVTKIYEKTPNFKLPYTIGGTIEHHERKVDEDINPPNGYLSFIIDTNNVRYFSYAINDDQIVDYYYDPDYVRRVLSEDQAITMIENANNRAIDAHD